MLCYDMLCCAMLCYAILLFCVYCLWRIVAMLLRVLWSHSIDSIADVSIKVIPFAHTNIIAIAIAISIAITIALHCIALQLIALLVSTAARLQQAESRIHSHRAEIDTICTTLPTKADVAALAPLATAEALQRLRQAVLLKGDEKVVTQNRTQMHKGFEVRFML
jgi:hypothetical protein